MSQGRNENDLNDFDDVDFENIDFDSVDFEGDFNFDDIGGIADIGDFGDIGEIGDIGNLEDIGDHDDNFNLDDDNFDFNDQHNYEINSLEDSGPVVMDHDLKKQSKSKVENSPRSDIAKYIQNTMKLRSSTNQSPRHQAQSPSSSRQADVIDTQSSDSTNSLPSTQSEPDDLGNFEEEHLQVSYSTQEFNSQSQSDNSKSSQELFSNTAAINDTNGLLDEDSTQENESDSEEHTLYRDEQLVIVPHSIWNTAEEVVKAACNVNPVKGTHPSNSLCQNNGAGPNLATKMVEHKRTMDSSCATMLSVLNEISVGNSIAQQLNNDCREFIDGLKGSHQAEQTLPTEQLEELRMKEIRMDSVKKLAAQHASNIARTKIINEKIETSNKLAKHHVTHAHGLSQQNLNFLKHMEKFYAESNGQ